MRLLALWLCLLLPLAAAAQITDDFSDGDFTANPTWQGDVSEFKINTAGELQLNAPDAGSSKLWVQGNVADSSVWNLAVRLEFAPSTSNLLRIFLLATDTTEATGSGYLLEMGENGSADALRFVRRDGPVGALLATGTPGLVGTDPVNVHIRATRSAEGLWTVELAVGSGAFQPQFTVSDATYPGGPARWFGVECVYSATRKDKFFFDNLSILPNVPDTQPPVLLGASVLNLNNLEVAFDEPVDSASAVNLAHYSLSGGTVSAATWFANTPAAAFLTLATPLNNGQLYTLTTTGVEDTLGNASVAQSAQFQPLIAQVAQVGDLVINELMPDPAPSAGLPATVEWIELLNRSPRFIDLATLRLADSGGAPQALPSYLLRPDSAVVLCSATLAGLLQPFTPNVAGVSNFPSLNNDTDVLSLSNTSGLLIDRVGYSLSWHTDPAKEEGGWTLERINPDLPCSSGDNWQSCPQPPGGSPGKRNFSWNDAPDATPPAALTVSVINATLLAVRFSEGLNVASASNPLAYRLSPSLPILSAEVDTEDPSNVTLSLGQPLASGVLYALTFGPGGPSDCSGNSVAATDTLRLGLSEVPANQDIVINEVLFDPATGGSRFVEFYNRSNKIFEVKNFFLTDGTTLRPVERDQFFLPGTYAVLATDPDDVVTRFANTDPTHVLELALPSWDARTDLVHFYWELNGQRVTLDSLVYDSDWHNPLLSVGDRDGVSLERIRTDGPTNLAANWTSAARNGTPTQPNSQSLPPVQNPDNELIRLPVARISPDDDGYEDFLDIQYELPSTGFAATLTVYDSEGTPVKKLVRQQLIGTSGSLQWFGDASDGSKARPGIYILFLEVFSPDGVVQRVKKPFAVVERW